MSQGISQRAIEAVLDASPSTRLTESTLPAPDALASTANYLKSYVWRRGEPWSEGTENFNVLLEWNKARVYAKTIAAFAERLAAGSR